jgi:peroxin-3
LLDPTHGWCFINNLFTSFREEVLFQRFDMSGSQQRRRQRPLLPSAACSFVSAAVVAYGTYRLASWAWDTWNTKVEEDDDDLQDQTLVSGMRDVLVSDPQRQLPQTVNSTNRQRWRLRRQRMERCREEASYALYDFLPTLRRAIENLTDTTEETKELKKMRSERRGEDRRCEETELWDSIKVKAMTRMIATAYGHSILFLVLTVQVHLLGGRLFDEQMKLQTTASSLGADSLASGRMSSYQASHRIVLTRTYEYFFDKGIALLVETVERAVIAVTGAWDVTSPASMNTTCEMLNNAVKEIREIVEGRSRRSSRRPRSMLRFLLPPEQATDAAIADDLSQSVLDETWDLMESPVFEDAQRDALGTTFDMMRDESWAKIFKDGPDSLPEHASSQYTTKPLANVITKLKATSKTFFDHAQASPFSYNIRSNRYTPAIQRIPTVMELGDVSFN